jgi:hypothetical protein
MYQEITSVNNIIYILIDNISIKELNYIVQPSVETKIKSFANLDNGWDYGRGGPIQPTTIRLALSWSRFLRNRGLLEIDAFPGESGEIVVSADHGDHYCEVIIEPDHTISIAYDFKGKQMYYKPNMSESDARFVILGVVRQIWNVFDYYTRISLIVDKINLHGQLSETQKTTVAYQSWAVNAFRTPAH